MNRRSAGHERSLLVDHPNVTTRRRTTSSSKLPGFFWKESETDKINVLLEGINDLEIAGKFAAKSADAQRRGAAKLAKWADGNSNAAIEDVTKRSSELFSLFADKEVKCSLDRDHFLQELKKIAEAEADMKRRKAELKALRKKEKKLQEELSKGNGIFFKRKSSETLLLREQLEKVICERELAEHKYEQKRNEAEVNKMLWFRCGMKGIADSYRNLANHCQAIFECHREISELVPAISTQDVTSMFYDGIPYTRERVELLRRSLNNEIQLEYNPPSARRRSEPSRHRSTGALRNAMGYSPPPPYSATAPNYASEMEELQHITPIANETPRIRSRSNIRSRSGHLRRSVVTVVPPPPRDSPSSSSSDDSPSQPLPSQMQNQNRLYPSLSFSSTDAAAAPVCPLKEFGIPARSTYAM